MYDQTDVCMICIGFVGTERVSDSSHVIGKMVPGIAEIVVIAIVTVITLVVVFLHKRTRLDPLKKSEKVKISLNLDTSLETFHVYLPESMNFIENMGASVERERNELNNAWTVEKNIFPRIWDSYSMDKRRELVSTLLNELQLSIEVYSDSDRLLHSLCPFMEANYLLSVIYSGFNNSSDESDVSNSKNNRKKGRKTPVTDRTNSSRDGDGEPSKQDVAIIDFITHMLDKLSSKTYCRPLFLLSASRVDGDVDPNRAPTVDTELSDKVELFLRNLQQLCALKFCKQLLNRYKIAPKESIVIRVLKKIGPVTFFGLLAAGLTYVLDQYGVLEAVLVKYQSPFK